MPTENFEELVNQVKQLPPEELQEIYWVTKEVMLIHQQKEREAKKNSLPKSPEKKK